MTDSKTTTRGFDAELVERLPKNEFGITPEEALEQRLLIVPGVIDAAVAPPVDEDKALYWVTIVRQDGYDRADVLAAVEQAITGQKCCPKVSEEEFFDELVEAV